MKYVKMWGVGRMCDVRLFKWQWAVLYEFNTNYGGLQPDWKPSISMCPDRARARRVKRAVEDDPKCRNVRLARRLVEGRWTPYNDSFTWNRGCGKR